MTVGDVSLDIESEALEELLDVALGELEALGSGVREVVTLLCWLKLELSENELDRDNVELSVVDCEFVRLASLESDTDGDAEGSGEAVIDLLCSCEMLALKVDDGVSEKLVVSDLVRDASVDWDGVTEKLIESLDECASDSVELGLATERDPVDDFEMEVESEND